MTVPKKRTSRTRRDKGRTHKKLESPQFYNCPQCKEPKRPHEVCPNCGFYRGREVVPTP
ncbi:MAG TPA: 50S ribosomal protein L32 [bacterium]|nr:50S ribosomal protein L32 [bacterium]